MHLLSAKYNNTSSQRRRYHVRYIAKRPFGILKGQYLISCSALVPVARKVEFSNTSSSTSSSSSSSSYPFNLCEFEPTLIILVTTTPDILTPQFVLSCPNVLGVGNQCWLLNWTNYSTHQVTVVYPVVGTVYVNTCRRGLGLVGK